ncbi:FUN14 domain-containing protein 2-like isoform X2 [Atheta coriaria]|uniref:FUN14 domain-containing protein 2-like isoform X2 n=1 Tax=Dalotia coriaria TaxID=877792 RepID=UPI0031F38970
MPIIKKFAKDKSNKVRQIMDARPGEDKSIIDKLLGDISKSSATKQLIIGTSSGWLTGYVFMKVGKVVAVAIGGGIILLQVANENGYVKINWNKVNKNLDKVADKVEEKITGEGPSWSDKITAFAKTHMSFTTGFVGGVFLAFGCV